MMRKSYQVGGSLPVDAPSYVQRQADDQLYQYLQQGEFCYILNSRQMGKSSLRVRTMQRLQTEGFQCVAVDLTAIGTYDLTSEEWYAGIIDTIIGTLELYKRFDLDTWWEQHQRLSNVQRFCKFVEVLLDLVPEKIIIFLDEIDSILSLKFPVDDFFALIRACYNQRVDNQEYQRITFVLLGVATPSDLIQDKTRTPFNIGQGIDLTGFSFQEALPLTEGLVAKTSQPHRLLQAILTWTGGQPFLTQKLCRLVQDTTDIIPENVEFEWLEKLVTKKIIDNWESQDTPEHLRTIRDRILQGGGQLTGRLLGLYQQIIQQQEIIGDDSPEQMKLRLTGLVVRRDGKLRVYNPIYTQIFTQNWVEQELANLRPYAQSLSAWLASNCQDESRLLRGQALQEALSWSSSHSLSVEDYRFLTASQEFVNKELQTSLQQERETKLLIETINSLNQSNLDLGTNLARVMKAARELIHAARSTLWLIDYKKNDLWTEIELLDGSTTELRVPVGVGFAGKVATENLKPERYFEGYTLNIAFDFYNYPDYLGIVPKIDQQTSFRTCSLLCMPVFDSTGKLIAITQLVNKEKPGDFPAYNPDDFPAAPEKWQTSFTTKDEQLMRAFNAQAGIILERAKLFAQIKQQQQCQQDILRSLTNGVISTDTKGIIIAINNKAKQLLGFDDNAVLEGKQIKNIINLKNANFENLFASAFPGKNGKFWEQYYPDQILISSNQKEQNINLSINSIADANDISNIYGALVLLDDISDEKRLKNQMYRYMTQDLAEKFFASKNLTLTGERQEVTVLFSDIRKYTAWTRYLTPETVVTILNEYFESMVEAIFAHEGILDKYIGDALMAVFGSPVPLENHALKAVKSALEMRERLQQLNTRFIAENKELIEIGIGINSGWVISGNIGSSKRMEFTSIGDGVNLSSRLEGCSNLYGCDIVISENTYKQCQDAIIVRELDLIQVKNQNQTLAIYELIALKSDSITEKQEQIIELYQQGREYYLNQQFALALHQFEQVLDIAPDNQASEIHRQRCQYFLANPPSPQWDGVWKIN
ncbi:MAG: GAF domain-containing protein [Moorea sp. SIO2B7]|nr:GAF domain-containing protein [Moorena sp. SIO2B7]